MIAMPAVSAGTPAHFGAALPSPRNTPSRTSVLAARPHRSRRGQLRLNGPREVKRQAYKTESGEEIPQAVVEAEENSASGRKYRMAAFGIFGGLAGLLTLARVGFNVAGVAPPSDFLEPSVLGELLDIIVVGTAGILWNEELSTKEANIERIWEEVQKRRTEADPKIVTMEDLRQQRKAKKKAKKAAAKGFSRGNRPETASGKEVWPPSAQDAMTAQKDTDEGANRKESKGVFGFVKSALDSANDAGRIQALQINDSLEKAGVLEPLVSSDDDKSESDSGSAEDKK